MGFKGVLDPATNPLIDNRGRYISQLLEENELDPVPTGKETNISEWQEAKGRSSVKLQHPPSTEHITNTENGYKALHYITQLMEGGVLWSDLGSIIDGITSPHVVMGDFNTILRSDDRVMGSQVIDSEVMDFNNFIQDTGLMELKRLGRRYTWTNNPVYNKIDWILVNANWIQKWPHSVGICMDPQLSDHSPLCIELEQQVVSGTKPFRFYNYLAEHEQFLREVQTA
ncbi:hypothetical protein CQW23_18992 [Capsicum baccatum]|uniref:Endonuclease/exonuclease/phosphatase domain-containing protein n=1 Tax=Capsicum baccatum TaxID=33114 RepID=A0A2G2W4J0_CAPBA|nr:hypothetical protein CQW23_18992 [Capsicum baccatum]